LEGIRGPTQVFSLGVNNPTFDFFARTYIPVGEAERSRSTRLLFP
jgi:hypothetical protein